VNVAKRYLIAAAAHNLGRMLRKLFGIGKPRVLQGEAGSPALTQLLILAVLTRVKLWLALARRIAADFGALAATG
jgi:transposase